MIPGELLMPGIEVMVMRPRKSWREELLMPVLHVIRNGGLILRHHATSWLFHYIPWLLQIHFLCVLHGFWCNFSLPNLYLSSLFCSSHRREWDTNLYSNVPHVSLRRVWIFYLPTVINILALSFFKYDSYLKIDYLKFQYRWNNRSIIVKWSF